MDAVEKGRPACCCQHHRAEIPFLKVVSDVADHVSEIHWMTNKSVRSGGRQPAQRRTNSEQSSQSEETAKTQACRERYQDESQFGPYPVAGEPAEVDDLRICVAIRDHDGDRSTN